MIECRSRTSNLVLRKLNKEQLLARILNEMENLVQNFQEFGPDSFLEKYYHRWLHR
jgi:biotin-(acetyl-CoA carboxylase) ligase